MATGIYERAAMASAALELSPPLIRKSLLDDRRFSEKHGLKPEYMIALEPGGISIPRSELFEAVRAVLAGKDLVELHDVDGRVWSLTIDACDVERPNLVLSSNQQRLVLPDFSVLSGDASTRIRYLDESASDVALPLTTQKEWRSILRERSLEDNEVDILLSDIRDTPVHMERTIRRELSASIGNVSVLVPNSRRYFERLVGAHSQNDSIRDFAVTTGREVFGQLTKWQPYDGFLHSLLLSSHSALVAEIKADHLDQEQLEKAFDYLEINGDMLSRLGACEVGLRILSDRPEIRPFLLRLIYRIRDDDANAETSEFRMFSALFVLVYGELARLRLMSEQPPFYRRLASLAQAALIHRQFLLCGIDYRTFSDWAFGTRGERFYMQSLVDMRTEPRWNPDLADAPQMQMDFFGRIMIAGNCFEANLGEGELRDIILGKGEQSLINRCEFPRPYLPGPLEGAEDSPNALPDDLAQVIEKQLDSKEVAASSFIALVNSALVFRITSGQAELAAKALRLCHYSLTNLRDQSQLVSILNGLATVAAVSRSPALADEIRILVRRYRHDSQYRISVEQAMTISLVASAAREDISEWRGFAGEWLTELAFGELEGNDGEIFRSHLSALLHSAPELWVSCARADAALQSWCLR